MQICTNFKDPALQKYGGEMFATFQNQMDTIFIKMAPPKPSAKKKKDVVYKPQPVNMKAYYNNYGGCIDGECRVTFLDKFKNVLITKKIKHLKKGDIVIS
eukprot:GHVR01058237.1.p2 GENE.GHVR01058237.1~~GHVR01058237.1.p2  ORF type:complete len:100 (+),score=3.05 GHVR01058237.1:6126-6425(+)